MPNTTSTPKLPAVTRGSIITFYLAWLTYFVAYLLLVYKFHLAARILLFLGAVPHLALVLVGARGLLATITYTAAARSVAENPGNITDRATENAAEKPTGDQPANTAPPTDPFPATLATLVLVYYVLLTLSSLGCFALAIPLLILTYTPDDMNRGIYGMSGAMFLVALVAAVIELAIFVALLPILVKMIRRVRGGKGKEGKGVESV